MNKLLLDSSAWIEYLKGTDKGRKVRENVFQPDTEIFTTWLIAAEICSKFIRESRNTDEIILAISSLAALVSLDYESAQQTAATYIKERNKKSKFGLADAHVVTAARKIGARILTFDNDFENIPEAIIL